MPESHERVRDYFRVKARQLRASAELAVCDHKGLAGSHREELQRIYLSEVLPRRFEVGRGMVYGLFRRSREADIVIWDSKDYPSLPMLDHAFFFAESVRMVLESKSRWSRDDFNDVLLKSRAVRDIISSPGTNLDDTLAMLQLDVAALKEGRSHAGILRSAPLIATGAIFLAGGSNALLRPAEIIEAETLRDIDDQWPDILLLLEPGRVVFKHYSEEYGGRLFFYEYGEDALLAFTNRLLQAIADRAVVTEGEFYLTRYAIEALDSEPYAVVKFPLTRIVPGRTPLWE